MGNNKGNLGVWSILSKFVKGPEASSVIKWHILTKASISICCLKPDVLERVKNQKGFFFFFLRGVVYSERQEASSRSSVL